MGCRYIHNFLKDIIVSPSNVLKCDLIGVSRFVLLKGLHFVKVINVIVALWLTEIIIAAKRYGGKTWCLPRFLGEYRGQSSWLLRQSRRRCQHHIHRPRCPYYTGFSEKAHTPNKSIFRPWYVDLRYKIYFRSDPGSWSFLNVVVQKILSVLTRFWLGDGKVFPGGCCGGCYSVYRFPFSALTLWDVDWATGRVSVCRWWWLDWSFARLIAPLVTTHHLPHP